MTPETLRSVVVSLLNTKYSVDQQRESETLHKNNNVSYTAAKYDKMCWQCGRIQNWYKGADMYFLLGKWKIVEKCMNFENDLKAIYLSSESAKMHQFQSAVYNKLLLWR